MVSTRRSRSQTAQTEDGADVGQGSQQEVSSGKNSGKDNASDGQRAPGQLQPIAEEPAEAAATAAAAAAAEQDAAAEQQDGHEQQEQQHTVSQTRQSQQRARPSQQQQQQLAQPQQPAAVHVVAPAAAAAAASEEDEDSETEAAVAADADDEDDWDFDGPDMLQNLAASIRSALGASEPTGQRLHAAAAAAAGSDSDAEDMELDNLRWRPQTGLQLPARAARVVAAAAAGNQQQRELTAAGPQVHNPAVAAAADDDDLQDMSAAAAAAPPPEGPSVAAATKPKGLAKQLPAGAAAAEGKQQGGKKGSRKGAAAAGAEGADRKWYQLPAVEITDEVKRDLRLLRLRGAYDPKRFYKSFDETKFPKHFAIGTVVDDALDFYGGRLSAGQRKATLTEQLLADQELQHTRKKRYGKLQEDAQKWVKHKKRKTSQPRKTPSKHRPKH